MTISCVYELGGYLDNVLAELDQSANKSGLDSKLDTVENLMNENLQAAKIQQRKRSEEIQNEVLERRKQIEIEEQEIKRKEK